MRVVPAEAASADPMSSPQQDGGYGAAVLLRHLMARGIVTPSDAVDHGVAILDASMSHRSWLVRLGDRPWLFAKQADAERTGGRDLRVESRFHLWAGTQPVLRELVPRCRLATPGGALIVMDAPDAGPLDVATLLCERSGVTSAASARDRAIVSGYAAGIARLHALAPPALGPAPWLLMALEPRPETYDEMPAPCGELLRRLGRRRDLVKAFRNARRCWRRTGLVHGDLRCANVLVERSGDMPRVWLVDWELATRGDRAWDVAAVIAELIAIALLWHPDSDPWLAVRASTLVFLRAYREVWRPSDEEWNGLVARATRFAGARLVQTLIEVGYAEPQSLPHAEVLVRPWLEMLLLDAGPIASAFDDVPAPAPTA